MATYKSDFINVMMERGFFNQATNLDGMDELLVSGPQVAYCGYDPTADSLHVGHMVTIMMLYWFQQTGNKVLTLMGGATGLVGDPSFKDEARPLLGEEGIAENIAGIKQGFRHLIRYGDDEHDAIMVNNADWLKGLGYIEFLRDYGTCFSVNRMLSFDSVKIRLEREQSLSFLEFNYMLMQAFDFVELYKRHNCRIQLSGADQWGNVVNGVELGRRKENVELFGFTCPLLTTSSGKKMGKSEGNAVWLNEDKLSNFDFYQYWRNTEDGDVIRFMKIFTPMTMADIAKYEKLEGQEINEAKKVLAYAVTKLVRGQAAAEEAQETARQAFELGAKATGLPTFEMSMADFAGKSYLDLFVECNLTSSKGEARRLAQGGGAKINDNAIDDKTVAAQEDIDSDGMVKLSAGKKKHALIKVA